MSHRFFLDQTPAGSTIRLQGDQAHHANHVMRYQRGDSIVLFDGTGAEWHATIQELKKKEVLLKVDKRITITRSIARDVEIAVALPKGDRQKFLIEKLVELGARRVIPLKTSRSVSVCNDKVIARLNKQIIEASKQCGRNVLMEIGPETTVKQLIQFADDDVTRLVADPYQGVSISNFSVGSGKVLIAIGPEGGLNDDENQAIRDHGFQPVIIGPAILRVETAALAAASILGVGSQPETS